MSPVTDVDFPSVTICTAGMNLNAVKAALRLGQMKWEKNKEDKSSKRRKRDAEDQDDLDPEYLRSRFGSPDFPVLEVVKGLDNSSPDPRAADLQLFAATCLQGVKSDPICAEVEDLLEISMVRTTSTLRYIVEMYVFSQGYNFFKIIFPKLLK